MATNLNLAVELLPDLGGALLIDGISRPFDGSGMFSLEDYDAGSAIISFHYFADNDRTAVIIIDAQVGDLTFEVTGSSVLELQFVVAVINAEGVAVTPMESVTLNDVSMSFTYRLRDKEVFDARHTFTGCRYSWVVDNAEPMPAFSDGSPFSESDLEDFQNFSILTENQWQEFYKSSSWLFSDDIASLQSMEGEQRAFVLMHLYHPGIKGFADACFQGEKAYQDYNRRWRAWNYRRSKALQG